MSAPASPLVDPAALAQFGVPPSFVVQFQPRSLNAEITNGGVLGVMSFCWQWRGEDNFNPQPFVSSAGTTWVIGLDETFTTFTWPAGTYILGANYQIDEVGTVTASGGGPSPTVVRYDLRSQACSAVTSEAMLLMRNAVSPPLLTWGDAVRTHAAAMVYAWLKRARGLTANTAGSGDENVFAAEATAREFFILIGEQGLMDDMTDSSTSVDGPIFNAYPTGDTARNW